MVELMLGVALIVVACAWAYRESQMGSSAPAANPAASVLSKQAQLVARQSSREESLGFLTKLFDALADNDADAMRREVEYLARLTADSGSFATLLDGFLTAQIKARSADPVKQKQLLELIENATGKKVVLAAS